MVERDIPDFIARTFDVEELLGDDTTTLALDIDGVIVWVNPAWRHFAERNDASDVAVRFGVGTRYLDGVSGPLASYFEAVFDNVRQTGEPWEFDYECSSPDTFRLMHMRVLPIAAGRLLIQHSTECARPHDRVADEPIEARYRDAWGLLLQCSNCRRVRDPGDGWHWVFEWVAQPPERVSHGLCSPCAAQYFTTVRRARGQRREMLDR